MTVAELSEEFRLPLELLDKAAVRHAADGEVRGIARRSRTRGPGPERNCFPLLRPAHQSRAEPSRAVRYPAPRRTKYLSEQGCRALFFLPIRGGELTEVSITAAIVESEKAALALTALADRQGLKYWSWQSAASMAGGERLGSNRRQTVNARRTGRPSSNWVVCWRGRKVILAFDSNVAGRRDLEKARRGLADELRKREAQVLVASVPACDNVDGPDDLIALRGD